MFSIVSSVEKIDQLLFDRIEIIAIAQQPFGGCCCEF